MKLSTSIDEARNAYQRESAYSAYTRSAYGVAGPPATPTGFMATAQESAILLGWDAQPEADTFEILYSTSNTFGTAVSLAAGITGTSFTFDSGESIQVGEKYYFWIQATNGAGTSGYAGSVTARSYVTVAGSGTANLTTPTGTWTLTTLFFRSGGNLPAGGQVTFDGGSQIGISLGDGTWEDGIMGGTFDPSISGAFTFDNLTGSPITFWDAEP